MYFGTNHFTPSIFHSCAKTHSRFEQQICMSFELNRILVFIFFFQNNLNYFADIQNNSVTGLNYLSILFNIIQTKTIKSLYKIEETLCFVPLALLVRPNIELDFVFKRWRERWIFVCVTFTTPIHSQVFVRVFALFECIVGFSVIVDSPHGCWQLRRPLYLYIYHICI